MKKINKIAEIILLTMAVMILVIVFAQVLLRIFGVSLIWVEELSRFLFIWIVFLGAAVGIKYGVHLNVDLFVAKRKKTGRIIFIYIGGALQIIFIGVLLIFSVVLSKIWIDSTSPVLGIPIILVYSALPVSALLMAANTIVTIINDIKKIKEEVQ